jgi:hypothetical protein
MGRRPKDLPRTCAPEGYSTPPAALESTRWTQRLNCQAKWRRRSTTGSGDGCHQSPALPFDFFFLPCRCRLSRCRVQSGTTLLGKLHMPTKPGTRVCRSSLQHTHTHPNTKSVCRTGGGTASRRLAPRAQLRRLAQVPSSALAPPVGTPDLLPPRTRPKEEDWMESFLFASRVDSHTQLVQHKQTTGDPAIHGQDHGRAVLIPDWKAGFGGESAGQRCKISSSRTAIYYQVLHSKSTTTTPPGSGTPQQQSAAGKGMTVGGTAVLGGGSATGSPSRCVCDAWTPSR